MWKKIQNTNNLNSGKWKNFIKFVDKIMTLRHGGAKLPLFDLPIFFNISKSCFL